MEINEWRQRSRGPFRAVQVPDRSGYELTNGHPVLPAAFTQERSAGGVVMRSVVAATVLLTALCAQPSAGQYFGPRNDVVFSCDTRPVEHPRPLSRTGNEPMVFASVWGAAKNDTGFQLFAPLVGRAFAACLERARSLDAETWRPVASLSLSAEQQSDDGWIVRTRFLDDERQDTVSSHHTPPWEMAGAINGWILEKVPADERPALRDMLWTLWLEGFLATLPKTFFGQDVGDQNRYIYVDTVERFRKAQGTPPGSSTEAALKDRWKAHRPGFQPVFHGRRILVNRILDPALAAYENLEVTSWDGRKLSEWDRDELYDFWVREEPFEVTFEVAGREEPVRARSRPYGLPWDLTMGFYGSSEKMILYVRIAEFVPVTGARLRGFLPVIRQQGLSGLVVDLRGNPGGRSQPDALGLLFKRGVMTMTMRRPLRPPRNLVSTDGGYADVPLIVLIDGGTGSMAEAFAAAVRQHGRGLVIGERTFGKASMQLFYEVQDEGALSMTQSLLFYPGTAESWQGEGVEPHIEVKQGAHAELVAKALRRPLADMERLYHYDPVYKRAMQLFLGGAGEWEALLNPQGGEDAKR